MREALLLVSVYSWLAVSESLRCGHVQLHQCYLNGRIRKKMEQCPQNAKFHPIGINTHQLGQPFS